MPDERKDNIMPVFVDHGLPIVQLKEQRRELVLSMQGASQAPNSWQLAQLAALQEAIKAFEEVCSDLDAEHEIQSAEVQGSKTEARG